MKNKTTAGLFALFLGGIGIHKFYLGKTSTGILYLLFCWTFIPAMAAVIEGIIYLTMTDTAFNLKYNSFYVHTPTHQKKRDEISSLENRETKNREIKRTIFDFFKLDISSLPNDSFIKAESGTTSAGDSTQTYRKALNYKECNIFDTVEVIVIGGINTNVFFQSFNPDAVNLNALKELIDDLYLIYGPDSNDKGKFTNNDINDYRDEEFCILFGRSWLESPKYQYPILLSRDEQTVSLTIWGTNKKV